MEANILTEPPIAAIGAQKRNPEHIAALQAAIDLEASIPPDDGHGYMAANAAFHDAIARLVDNRAIYLYLRGNDWISSILFAELVRVAEVQGEVLDAHKHIVKAIVRRQRHAGPSRCCASTSRPAWSTASASSARCIDQPVRWH